MEFFVRSAEIWPCPCCQGALAPYGRRSRVQVLGTGEVRRLLVRRLRCNSCRRVHHELPAELVPYKRYAAASIEQALHQRQTLDVAADESTLGRWRRWFGWWAPYACGCLEMLGHRLAIHARASSAPLHAALCGLGRYVGDAPGWLPRVVRPLAHAHLWPTTRSAWVASAS